MKSRILALAIVFALALSTALFGCSPTEKANSLFEEGKYREALEEYQKIDPDKLSDEEASNFNECRFYAFIDHIRDKGKLIEKRKINNLDANCTITAKESGEIEVSIETSDKSTATRSTTNIVFTMTIPHGNKTASVVEAMDMTLSGSTVSASLEYEGEFDIGTYKLGDSVTLKKTRDNVSGFAAISDRSLGGSSTSQNATYVKCAVEALKSAAEKSDTGCTMSIIGFDKI